MNIPPEQKKCNNYNYKHLHTMYHKPGSLTTWGRLCYNANFTVDGLGLREVMASGLPDRKRTLTEQSFLSPPWASVRFNSGHKTDFSKPKEDLEAWEIFENIKSWNKMSWMMKLQLSQKLNEFVYSISSLVPFTRSTSPSGPPVIHPSRHKCAPNIPSDLQQKPCHSGHWKIQNAGVK